MSSLVYAGVRLDSITTVEQEFRVVMDPTGTDRECLEVTLAVEGVWSEFGLGSGKPFANAPTFGQRGDRMGVSLYNLRDVLSAPRQALLYYVGTDLVHEAPQRNAAGVRYACDVKGGPFPEVLSVSGNVGDKSALVRFRVKSYVSACEHYLLSNRYRITDHADPSGFASLSIQGRASFRKDFLVAGGLQPDDWRRWLFYPCELRMRRYDIQVTVSADGTEVEYQIQDRETNYGTGANSLIANVACHVTSSNDYPIKTAQQEAAAWATGAGQVLGAGVSAFMRDPAGVAAGLAGLIGGVVGNSLATCYVGGVCQITGQPGVDRFYLARVAQAVMHDRCRTWDANKKVTPVNTRLSVDWSSDSPPWVEFQAAYRVPLARVAETLFRNNETSLLNWDPRISGAPLMNLNWDQDTPRVQLPGGNNTRAENVGRLVAQALSRQSCETPGLTAQIGDPASGRTVKALNTDDIDRELTPG